ncbi:hypothetical protein BU26DRAFT_96687 [Trematosphaeria pertusa]|uniref:Uncharacterized protein n=1 Tax=Trematosphaeria pertusa TaxID=390896 RepID=A0A6A6I180_9PLEO|nr:uncharacterized protein BU26DRAFT_96687 [Trematosphaeria pertusa]KAF2244254.1 hypothetical protein BU26DRAFT_96687 [Trematosphaeria pertusa]
MVACQAHTLQQQDIPRRASSCPWLAVVLLPGTLALQPVDVAGRGGGRGARWMGARRRYWPHFRLIEHALSAYRSTGVGDSAASRNERDLCVSSPAQGRPRSALERPALYESSAPLCSDVWWDCRSATARIE